jgi:DNA-binding response OmpR family regulator
LLLLDLNLPSRSGWDAFERFTALNPLLPVIIITGRDRQYELAEGAGVGALMEKPLDVPLLLKTIADLIAEPAELRLKRLTGREHSLLYFPSAAVSAATVPPLRVHRNPEAQNPGPTECN